MVGIPENQIGPWRIERFTTDTQDWHALFHGRAVPMGKTFTRLMRKSTLVMSDTPAEKNDLRKFVYQVRGEVLIVGLGLGVALEMAAEKETVKHITVIEKSPEVIELVWSYYKEKFGDKIDIVQADIFEWEIPRGSKWDVVWLDIWDNICRDNIPEIKKLKQKFARRKKWIGAWAEEYIR